jgi:hypothetical protein
MKQLQDTLDTATAPDSASVELGALYEPPPVSFSFEPVGWSILAGILIVGVLILAIVLVRNYIRNRYRRDALQTLDSIAQQESAANQIFVLLKQVAIQAYGRERVGPLYGKEWLQFLDSTGKDVQLQQYEDQLKPAMYAGQGFSRETKNKIVLNAKQWIKTHAR